MRVVTTIEMAYLMLVIGVFLVFAITIGVTTVIDRTPAHKARQPEQILRTH